MGDKNASHSTRFLNQPKSVRIWSVAWPLALMIITLFQATPLTAQAQATDGKLRIIAFGAHPDDCELQASGTGALWAAKGHHVKFVSVTNGDIGHWREAGGPLALRRKREVDIWARPCWSSCASTVAFGMVLSSGSARRHRTPSRRRSN